MRYGPYRSWKFSRMVSRILSISLSGSSGRISRWRPCLRPKLLRSFFHAAKLEI